MKVDRSHSHGDHHEELADMLNPICRGCGAELTDTFCDLGTQPFSNDYLTPEQAQGPESHYPLHVWVCRRCFLVQIEAYESPERHFADYAYFSSFSSTWVEHARQFAEYASRRFQLTRGSLVVELASNDGYLLRWFHERGIPILGIEPAANIAAHAVALGLRTEVRFFGRTTAMQLHARGDCADLIVANNVLAHVPDIHDFVTGIEILLKPGALASIEFPHLLRLISGTQFDTIYHEHYSYLSLVSLDPIFAQHGLQIVDVEEHPTHGGSLRVFVGREPIGQMESARVTRIREAETAAGLDRLETYLTFRESVADRRDDFLRFLMDARKAGKSVAAYGAPAKGNTFLNYCGVRSDTIGFTVDLNPVKQNRVLPGSRIPIFGPEQIDRERPDYLIILPWNLRDEIAAQLERIRSWGGKFVTAIPELEIF